MAGKFVIRKNKSGQYSFVLKAGNGEIMSENYATKASAKSGIESVQKNAPGAAVEDESGE
jgi:uncharacterized protein YegP (UPF0339 family)